MKAFDIDATARVSARFAAATAGIRANMMQDDLDHLAEIEALSDPISEVVALMVEPLDDFEAAVVLLSTALPHLALLPGDKRARLLLGTAMIADAYATAAVTL